jgi:hypothetical protein
MFTPVFLDIKKKAEHLEGSSFGSSAVLFKDPPLSAPFLQKVWLYRELLSLYIFM